MSGKRCRSVAAVLAAIEAVHWRVTQYVCELCASQKQHLAGPSSCSSRVEAERSKLRKIHPAPNLRENGLAATNAAKVRGAVTLALLASAIVPDDGGAGVRLPEGAEKH